MAERFLSVAILERIAADVLRPVLLIDADFPSERRRIWTGPGTLEWSGLSWQGTTSGAAAILSLDMITESVSPAARGISAHLSGFDTDLIADLVSDDYQGRPVKVWLGFWDEDSEESLEVLPNPIWEGTLDTDEAETDGPTASLRITAEHALAILFRTRNYRCTQADQDFLYPQAGDKFFQFKEAIQDLVVPWGRTAS